ncbi:MAG TPA: hypothetical protein VD931_13825 [Baekduia sp.]|nr:hypothetical protein [Baekduia sp.]
MRFTELLRATVLLSGGAATTLALLTVVGASREQDDLVVVICSGWWAVCAVAGGWLGRRPETSAVTQRALAAARAQTSLPEVRPALLLVNRLWPLLVVVLIAAALALVLPQVAGVATGFGLLGALAWRRQEAAVQAIEDRDGVTFFVERTSPFEPVKLVRVPGMRRERPAPA